MTNNKVIIFSNTFDDSIGDFFPFAIINALHLDFSHDEIPPYILELASLAGYVEEESFECVTIVEGYTPGQLKNFHHQFVELPIFELSLEKIDVVHCLSELVTSWWDLQFSRYINGLPDYIDKAIGKQVMAELYYR